MATLLELHDAVKARLETISGLRVFNHPPSRVSPPAAFMVLTDWEPTTMSRGGFKTYRFDVYVLTAESVRPQDGYHGLLEYADSSGARSVELAVWDGNDEQAGTFADVPKAFARVATFRVLGQTEMDALQMYGGVFAVEIQTRS